MSVKATTWVWDHSEASGSARLVLLAIADAADQAGENAWPSQQTIADMCRISVRTVRRLVAALVELGELEVFEHGGAAYREDRRPHRYRLVKMPRPAGGQPVPPRPSAGGQEDANGRTKRAPRADTAVPITSFLDPSFQEQKNPSGGSADADARDDQESAMTRRRTPEPTLPLFDAPARTEPETQRPSGKSAGTVVALYVDSHRRHRGGDPMRSATGRVARDVGIMLREGRASMEELEAAARLLGASPYANITVEVNKLRDRRKPQDPTRGLRDAVPADDPRWAQQAEAEAAARRRRLAEDPEYAALYAEFMGQDPAVASA